MGTTLLLAARIKFYVALLLILPKALACYLANMSGPSLGGGWTYVGILGIIILSKLLNDAYWV